MTSILDNAARNSMVESSSIASSSKTPVPIMQLLKPSVAAAAVTVADLPFDEATSPVGRVDILPKQRAKKQQLPKKKKSKSKSKQKAPKQKPAVEVAKPQIRLQAVRVRKPEIEVEHQKSRRRKQSSNLATIMTATATSTGAAAIDNTPVGSQNVKQERLSMSPYDGDDEQRDSTPSVSGDKTTPEQPKGSVTKHLRAMTTIFSRPKSAKKNREQKKEKKAAKKAVAKKAIAAVAASIAPAHSAPRNTANNLPFPTMKSMAPATVPPPRAAVVPPQRTNQSRTLVDLDDTPPATFESASEEDLRHQGEIVAVDEEMATQPSVTSYSNVSLNKLIAEKAAEKVEASMLHVEPPQMEIFKAVEPKSPRARSATPRARSKTPAKPRAKTPTKSRPKSPAKTRRDSNEIPMSIGFPATEEAALEESDENVVVLTTKEKAALMVEESIAQMMPILPDTKRKSSRKKGNAQEGDDDDPNISQVIKKAALVTAIKRTKSNAKRLKTKETKGRHQRTDTFPDDLDLGGEAAQLFTCCHEEMMHIMEALPVYFKTATKGTPCDVSNMEIPSEIPCDTEKAKSGCKGAVKMALVAGMGLAAKCGAGDIYMDTSCVDDDISVLTDPQFTLGGADRLKEANGDDDDDDDEDDVHIVIVRSMDHEEDRAVVSPVAGDNIVDQAFANDGIIPVEDKPENENSQANASKAIRAVEDKLENEESQLWNFLSLSWSRSKVSKVDEKPELANLSETPAETPAPAPVQMGPISDIPAFHGSSVNLKGKRMTKKEKKSARKALRKAAAAAVAAVAASQKAKKKATKAKIAALNILNSYTSDVVSTADKSMPEEAAAAAVAALAAAEKAKADARAKIEALNNLKKRAKEAEALDDSELLVTSIPEESASEVPEVSRQDTTKSDAAVDEGNNAQEEPSPVDEIPTPVDESVKKSKTPKKKKDALLLPDVAPLIANPEEKEPEKDEIVQPRPSSRQRSRQMSRRRHEFEHRDDFFDGEREERTILSATSGALKSVRSGALKSVRSGALRSVRSAISGTGASARSPLRAARSGTGASSTRSPLRAARSGTDASSTRSPLRPARSGTEPSGRAGTKQSGSGTAQTGTDYTYRSAMSRRNEGQMAEMERLRAKRRHKKNSNTAPGNDEIEKARLQAALSSDSSLGVAKGNAYPLLDADDSEDEDDMLMMAVRPDATDNEVDLSVSSSIVQARTCLYKPHLT